MKLLESGHGGGGDFVVVAWNVVKSEAVSDGEVSRPQTGLFKLRPGTQVTVLLCVEGGQRVELLGDNLSYTRTGVEHCC